MLAIRALSGKSAEPMTIFPPLAADPEPDASPDAEVAALELASGSAELPLAGPVLTLPIADDLEVEIEVEIDGDEIELELELSWTRPRAGRSRTSEQGKAPEVAAAQDEAAEDDGATGWGRFRYITLPMLRPVLLFDAVITGIGYLQFFEVAFVMTKGGPLDATRSVT